MLQNPEPDKWEIGLTILSLMRVRIPFISEITSWFSVVFVASLNLEPSVSLINTQSTSTINTDVKQDKP